MDTLVIYNHPSETLGTFKAALKNYREVFAEELKDMENFDALVIMGGPMGVYERKKYPFLELEMRMIRKAFMENKHVLGICLGSQLIAEALGGTVIKGCFGREIGFQKVRLIGSLRDFLNLDELVVFQMHGDTFSLPEKAELLAYNRNYFQAFQIGKILGLQFHVEVNSELMEEWVRLYNESRELLNEIKHYESELNQISKKILDYWLSL
ncbi:MAG TPA: type 1 glutamine amidotransferase [Geobacterales bacterium]|nr:type 1 glutamine amidotransferase [Geobacterales bacterium]